MDKREHYVDNDLLYEEMVKWTNKNKGRIKRTALPDIVARGVIDIANGLIKRYNFSGYSDNWKQDMIADGIEDCIKGLHNFDPNKSKNVYGYINQTCWYAFIRRIKTEKRDTAILYKYYMYNVYGELGDDIEADEEFIQDIYGKMNEYEESIKVKKKEYNGPTLDI